MLVQKLRRGPRQLPCRVANTKKARQAWFSSRAIRYYEERSLLQPVTKMPGNYRLYDHQALRILKTFRRLKMLGMGLDDIAELKGIYAREGDCTVSLRERFLGMIQERIQQTNRRVMELTLLKEKLTFHHRLPPAAGAPYRSFDSSPAHTPVCFQATRSYGSNQPRRPRGHTFWQR